MSSTFKAGELVEQLEEIIPEEDGGRLSRMWGGVEDRLQGRLAVRGEVDVTNTSILFLQPPSSGVSGVGEGIHFGIESRGLQSEGDSATYDHSSAKVANDRISATGRLLGTICEEEESL